MAKTSPTVSDAGDLLTEISTAAVAAGWTEEQRYTEATNSYDTLALSQGGSFTWYIWWNSGASELEYTMNDAAHSAGKTYATFMGSSSATIFGTLGSVDSLTFPFTSCDVYATSQEVHIAMEFVAGRYRHFSFGTIEKFDAGSWTGGHYAVSTDVKTDTTSMKGSSACTMPWQFGAGSSNVPGLLFLGDLESVAPLPNASTWAYLGRNGTGSVEGAQGVFNQGSNVPYDALMEEQPNAYNQRSRYFSVYITVTATAGRVPLGYVRNVRAIEIDLISPGTEDSENAGWWRYPLLEKSATFENTPMTSEYEGIAYKA
jgi:hypothetical protein